ncbi:uncharacterized protein [Coffea arabica]|uniref:Uncharacterized protein n=1 Tax=Coffea arabica TaxID=13443 RepID=A0A6P6UXP5_COFAR|nr:sulfated surface glycoprotein 185-like [Coffea arabica]
MPFATIFASVDDKMFLFLLLLLLLATLCVQPPLVLLAQPLQPTSHITVQGSVFCDACYDNTFSRSSYFLPGAQVHIQCKFRAISPGTTEQITFSVNRTTNRHGIYNLDIPSVEGIDCTGHPDIQSFCEASLKGSLSPACSAPGLRRTTNEITIKSKQTNQCIYSLSALSYRPFTRNVTLCGNKKTRLPYSFNSSKFFLPYFPPYYGSIPWPPLPQFPPLPQLPPFPSFPFPPLPPLPSLPPLPPLPYLPPFPSWPFPQVPYPSPPPSPPSFTFPPLPPFPQAPPLLPPPASYPGTWIPNYPRFPPPPPPVPPKVNLGDPRTWIPYHRPSPPTTPQEQHP